MANKPRIPNEHLEPIIKRVVSGELSERQAVEELEKEGLPHISHVAIHRAVKRMKPSIVCAQETSLTLNDVQKRFGPDIVRLEKAISTHEEFIDKLLKDAARYESEGDEWKAHQLRKEVRENFVAETKAIIAKIELLKEHMTVIQKTAGPNSDNAYKDGYMAGINDAKTEFRRICEACRGTAITVMPKEKDERPPDNAAATQGTETTTA